MPPEQKHNRVHYYAAVLENVDRSIEAGSLSDPKAAILPVESYRDGESDARSKVDEDGSKARRTRRLGQFYHSKGRK